MLAANFKRFTKPACMLVLSAIFSQFAISEVIQNKQLAGFMLPQGSSVAGKQAFIDLQCVACHTVDGKALPAADEMQDVAVILSKATFIKPEAALVTAIVNPSHSMLEGQSPNRVFAEGHSKMPDYNDVMTVTQLIDLVAFLKQAKQ